MSRRNRFAELPKAERERRRRQVAEELEKARELCRQYERTLRETRPRP